MLYVCVCVCVCCVCMCVCLMSCALCRVLFFACVVCVVFARAYMCVCITFCCITLFSAPKLVKAITEPALKGDFESAQAAHLKTVM